MPLLPRAARRLLSCSTLLVLALALSACGSFDSAASGEHLIKNFVQKAGQGKVTVTSVSCPSGVKQVAGRTFNCRVKLHDKTSNSDSAGTITVHMASGNKVEITGGQDVHLQ